MSFNQAQDEPAESHEASPAAPAVSPQFCSAVFRSMTVDAMCVSMAVQLRLPRAPFDIFSALRCNSRLRVYEAGVAHEKRVRAMGGGWIGLIVLRMMVTGGLCGRDVMRLITSVSRRVAAVQAAATLDGALFADALFWGRPDLPEDHKRVFALASVSADMGCVHNKGVLGSCYAYGRGAAEDRAVGLQLGRESAAAGSCMGQFLVGKCFHAGWGVEQDFAESSRWYNLAAAQGHAVALCNLGILFEDESGVAQDHAEAVRFYRLAAAQGYANGHFNLARMFMKGRGVAQDHAEAVRIYRLGTRACKLPIRLGPHVLFRFRCCAVPCRGIATLPPCSSSGVCTGSD